MSVVCEPQSPPDRLPPALDFGMPPVDHPSYHRGWAVTKRSRFLATQHTQVVVVGGGLAGLTQAAALAGEEEALEDAMVSAAYRQRLARVLSERTLTQASIDAREKVGESLYV